MKRFVLYLRNKEEKTRKKILYTTILVIMTIIITIWILDLFSQPWKGVEIPFMDGIKKLPPVPSVNLKDSFIEKSVYHDPSFAISEEITLE